MSRILLLTTALIASAAAAHAEVTLSGDARMGVIKLFPPLGAPDDESLQFTSRVRVKVDMTGASDNGLSFGASFRLHDAEDATTGLAGEVFVSGDWGSISMGDVDSAALSAIDHVSYVGLTDLGSLNEVRYIANGFDGTDPSVLYRYNTGSWTFYASVVNPGAVTESVLATDTPTLGDFYTVTSETGVLAYSVAARYESGNYAVAVGYEVNKVDYGPGLRVDQQNLMLGVEGTFDKLRLKAIVGHFKGSDVDFNVTGPATVTPTQIDNLSGTQYAISADYAFNDATTVTAFYTDDSRYDGTQAYGIGATYDLGGGATVEGGYVKDKADGATSYDLGINMNF